MILVLLLRVLQRLEVKSLHLVVQLIDIIYIVAFTNRPLHLWMIHIVSCLMNILLLVNISPVLCGVILKDIKYHPVAILHILLLLRYYLIAYMIIVRVIIEELFLYIIRPLNLLVKRHIHFTKCVGCPEYAETIIILT